jgi:tight adherence protein B
VTPGLAAFLLSLLAAYGTFLVWTAVALRWRGYGVGPRPVAGRRAGPDLTALLAQAGLERVGPREFVASSVVLAVLGGLLGWSVFGGVLTPLAVGLASAWVPVGAALQRRGARREVAREAWPRLLEELRLQVVSLGRSVPQALFTVGARGPEEFRPAFADARRTWAISTDFDRTLDVLRARLADPTADAVCETLLIAHEVGGTDVDRRLRALVEDRVADLDGRKDARAEQAGARFARLFVLIVPLGMALVGLTIGQGREAYGSAAGQVTVLVALGIIAVCWAWASRFMRLPGEDRVFVERRPEARS